MNKNDSFSKAMTSVACALLVAVPLVLKAGFAETVEDKLATLLAQSGEQLYLIGTGLYDITGPAAEVGMMGFAESEQKTEGIYMRLWSRAYIVGDLDKRVVFVSADLGMIFQSVKQGVINKITADPELSEYYGDDNVLLSATHTHSGPGGYSHHFMYNVTTSGFISENYDLIVDGIYQSIKQAHNNLAPGRVFINQGDLYNASMNRSPLAYANNPEEERALYASDVDTTMTLLRLQQYDGADIGMINWFAVHPTNIGPTNKLIGGDNKGLASYFFEKDGGTNYATNSTFVAAFAQSNAGDVSPNLWGPTDGEHDYERQNVIASRQYEKARSLFDSAIEPLAGLVDFRHTYVDMSNAYVESEGVTTCPSAMGASFSAGSVEDNDLSVSLFDEGVTVDSLEWNEEARDTFLQSFLSGFVAIAWPDSLDEEYVECHGKKPILIPTGIATFDGNPWTPQVVPFQIIQIGQLKIVAAAAELTTMAGRRLQKTVIRDTSDVVVIAGLSNSYTSYVTTPEEYNMQYYEGASVHFGPNTLPAYEQVFSSLADALESGSTVNAGAELADLSDDQITLQTGVVFDDVPWLKNFGDVETQPSDSYSQGDRITVVFWGGHPKNDPLIGSSYADVEQLVDGEWTTVLQDLDPATTYHWARDGIAYSKITVTLDTSAVDRGTYRIRHRGHWKAFLTGVITAYEGVTETFTVN
jgi:neutral ceramidase